MKQQILIMKYTIIDLSDSSNYELVEELTKYFSNHTLVEKVEKETQK